ncbi:MAG: pectinesterase family protein [Polyangiales bacterium]
MQARRFILSLWLSSALPLGAAAESTVTLWPAQGATAVPPDTHLTLQFTDEPVVGTSGLIRIYDAADGKLVDTLDLSIPTSPNPSGRTAPNGASAAVPSGPYQVTIIDGNEFHFRPIIVRGSQATIYPHHNRLEHGHAYEVTMDASVLQPPARDFAGFSRDAPWTFTTRTTPPAADARRVTVAADGSGDFSTVQGAIDWLPARPAERTTILIQRGRYEEIVSLNKRSNLTLRGVDREGVVVGYANNTPFNPGRRWAFSIIDGTDIQLSNFTINNYAVGQAEALMVRGQRNIVDHMTLNGSGDALTTYGTLYFADSKLTGHGDTVLGYAAAFFVRSEIHSIGPFTWTRTPRGQHGNVFVDCSLIAIDAPLPWTVTPTDAGRKVDAVLARLPRNGSATATSTNFPFAEMVLIDVKTHGVPPAGWGPVEEPPGFDSSNVRFFEHNTTDMAGRPVDVSRRHPIARQLTLPGDADTIANYRRPEYVLGGWKPVVEPP